MGISLDKSTYKIFYENKFNSLYIERLINSIEVINNNNIISFYTSILFYDVIDIDILKIPPHLSLLFISPKIVHFLILKTLEIEIEYLNIEFICVNLLKKYKTSRGHYKCFEILLQFEEQLFQMSSLDPKFLVFLYQHFDMEEKLKIKNMHFSLITLEIFKEKEEFMDDFVVFCKSEELSDIKEAIKLCNSLNCNYIYKTIISSRNMGIRLKLKHYYKVYPESFINPEERLKYLFNPMSLPLDHKLLRIYVPIAYVAELQELKENAHFVYLNYIKKIIQCPSKELFLLVNDWIVQEGGLFGSILKTRLDLGDITYFVKEVPNVKLYFKESIQIAINTRNDYYFNLVNAIAQAYPSKKIIKLIKDNQFIMRQEHINNFSEYFKYLNNE